jgi:hypothetical protein
MILDLWQRFGLDPNNPMTVNKTTITAGGVTLTNSGSVVTRSV